MNTTANADYITAREVARLISASVRTVWRYVANGKLPQPIRWSRKLVRFSLSAVQAAIARKEGGSRD